MLTKLTSLDNASLIMYNSSEKNHFLSALKYLSILFTLVLNLANVSAQKTNRVVEKKSTIFIATSTSIISDIVKNISKNLYSDGSTVIQVKSIIPTGSDPHTYEPVSGDIHELIKSKIIFINGLHLEGWIDKSLRANKLMDKTVIVSEGVDALGSEEFANSQDPHAWTIANNGKIYAKNIATALEKIFPDRLSVIRSNLKIYQAKLDSVHRYVKNQTAILPPGKRHLVTTEDAFRYFAREYGWKVHSVLGTTTEAEPRTEDINQLHETIIKTGVNAIFIESTLNPKLLTQIATDAGVKIGGKLFSDSISDSIWIQIPSYSNDRVQLGSYEGMLVSNIHTIITSLHGASTGSNPENHTNQDSTYFWVIILLFMIGAFFYVAAQMDRNKFDLNEIKKHIRNISPESLKNLNTQEEILDAFRKDYTLDIIGLWVSYEKKTVLANIYLRIEPGKVYGVIGPNGSGKSTLFKSILGLVKSDAGEISLNGIPLSNLRPCVAYVPQKEEIDWSFPATVWELVKMGRYPHKGIFEWMNEGDKTLVLKYLKLCEIDHLRDRQIGELSGGQQQRAFIARALAQEAELYFFDEPFVGVDLITEAKIIEIIKQLAKSGKIVLIVHHDLSKVPEYFDSVILINQHIVAFGPTSEVFIPENISRTFSARSEVLAQSDHFI